MIKKSLIRAIGVSIGVMIGGYVLPRLMYKNCTPFIWKQALVYLIIGYSSSFLVFLLINFIKSKSEQ